MRPPPTIRHWYAGRTELSDRLYAALQAIAVGYRWIDRRDGMELRILDLAYFDAVDGFAPTPAGLALLEPYYEDMATC